MASIIPKIRDRFSLVILYRLTSRRYAKKAWANVSNWNEAKKQKLNKSFGFFKFFCLHFSSIGNQILSASNSPNALPSAPGWTCSLPSPRN